MNERNDPKKQSAKPNSREERLKAALKANLGRRKAQAKTRTSAQIGARSEQTPKGDT
ncbi:MAG: hypothetical protein P8P35_06145 [Planktotalea sp.]|jgi:hypothetical protein|uniref:hypothetical protein n=1 Tax=Planktotalea sp. TaxID=2029877 RepID=UPI000183916D|nr:hypothetical protein [Planktotalea sp.]EDZ43610.1 conserved hypothetical protein [Rhodobacteraceae bacterium HTCC2083]MDG1083680.1 hypothetical protein [Planktotalea sp.]